MDESQKSGVWPIYREPSKNWPLICATVAAMLLFLGVLVYLLDRMNTV